MLRSISLNNPKFEYKGNWGFAAHFYKELLICIECLYRCPVSFLVLGYETQKTT